MVMNALRFDWRAIRYWQAQPKREDPDITSEFIDCQEVNERNDWFAKTLQRGCSDDI